MLFAKAECIRQSGDGYFISACGAACDKRAYYYITALVGEIALIVYRAVVGIQGIYVMQNAFEQRDDSLSVKLAFLVIKYVAQFLEVS